MRRQRGSTLFELLTVLALVSVVAAIAVPSAAGVRRQFAAAAAAGRLALALRCAQAQAQARLCAVRVVVGPDGDYCLTEVADGTERQVAHGELGADVSSNYPAGTLEFGPRGWPSLPGAASPRAGRFVVGGAASGHTVIVQLSGCVRCV